MHVRHKVAAAAGCAGRKTVDSRRSSGKKCQNDSDPCRYGLEFPFTNRRGGEGCEHIGHRRDEPHPPDVAQACDLDINTDLSRHFLLRKLERIVRRDELFNTWLNLRFGEEIVSEVIIQHSRVVATL